MTTPTHRQQLLALLARLSFQLGQFKLSSGGTSDYYIDCRTTTLNAEGGRLCGLAILELLEENGIEAEAVAASSHRLGIQSMRERAAMLGGTVRFISQRKGTKLLVHVPLAGQAAQPVVKQRSA